MNEYETTGPLVDPESGQPVKQKRRRRTKAELEEAAALSALTDAEPKGQAGGRGRGSQSFAQDIRALIELGNAALASFPQTAEDALTDQETMIATSAIDKWQQTDKRAAKAFKRLRGAGGWIGLIYAGTIIAVPRMIRHGWLPGRVGEQMQATAEQGMGEYQQQQQYAYPQDFRQPAEPLYNGYQSPPPVYAPAGAGVPE